MGTTQNNYMAFEVREMSSGVGANSSQGSLVTYWPGVPNQGANGCSANVTWPVLNAITVLGASAVNTASVAVQVLQFLSPAMTTVLTPEMRTAHLVVSEPE